MVAVYLLIYVPIVLFVLAFLYETYLSLIRLRAKSKGSDYIDVTWETTHTLLVFGVVMMLMFYTKNIDTIASVLFLPAFIAMTFLFIRGGCYIYLFYIRKNANARSWVDWLFMASHLGAAVSLVWTVVAFTVVLMTEPTQANVQFVPSFLIGLAGIFALIVGPMTYLYFVRKK